MSIKEDSSMSVSVLKRASQQLKSLKSEIALTYAQSTNGDQAVVKAKKIALAKIQAIENEIKGGIEQYVKKVCLVLKRILILPEHACRIRSSRRPIIKHQCRATK